MAPGLGCAGRGGECLPGAGMAAWGGLGAALAVCGAGPGREAGAAWSDSPETPHSRGSRGVPEGTPRRGRGPRVPTLAEPCPPSTQPCDVGWTPTLL